MYTGAAPIARSDTKLLPGGFTLLELLIVIALLTIISGLTIPSFTSYIRNQTLRQAEEQVLADMRSVQNKALNGVDYTSTTGYWAIKFPSSSPSQYIYYRSNLPAGSTTVQMQTECSGTTPTPNERSQILPGGIRIKNQSDKCFYFSFENGNASNIGGTTSPLSIGYPESTGAECLGIRTNAVGLIYPDDAVNCP